MALGLTALAVLLRLGIQGPVPEAVPFAFFYVSTLAAALLGGALASLVAIAAASLASWFLFLPPAYSFALSGTSAVNLAVFVATQGAVAALALVLRKVLRELLVARATLAGSDALLRAVFEQLPAAAFIVEADGQRVTLRSTRAAEILPGENPLRVPLFAPDGAALPAEAHPALRALGAGEPVDGERAQIRDGATWRHLEFFARPVRDATGQVIAAACTVFDVTARQAAEDAWHAKAAELEGVMTLAPVAVWFTYDPEVREVRRNRFAADMLGAPYNSTEPLAPGPSGGLRHVTLWRDGRPVAAEALPLQRALRGEASRDEEYEALFEDGTRKVLLSNAQPLRDATGRVVGAVSASLDITARKRVEAALRESIRSRELLQREADHRIKNSLQLVAAMLRLQRNRLRDVEAVAILDAAIGRVGAVAEAHGALQGSPDLRTVDLAAMLGDLCRFVGKLNPNVAISIRPEERPTLDAQRAIPLGLIVAELLTNAVRHAFPEEGGGTVEVAVRAEAETLRVEVRDDGTGMEGEPRRPGSLGAVLVGSLAAKIGATVTVETAPGHGTRVVISVPAAELAEEAA